MMSKVLALNLVFRVNSVQSGRHEMATGSFAMLLTAYENTRFRNPENEQLHFCSPQLKPHSHILEQVALKYDKDVLNKSFVDSFRPVI
jgi:hypothetical protein